MPASPSPAGPAASSGAAGGGASTRDQLMLSKSCTSMAQERYGTAATPLSGCASWLHKTSNWPSAGASTVNSFASSAPSSDTVTNADAPDGKAMVLPARTLSCARDTPPCSADGPSTDKPLDTFTFAIYAKQGHKDVSE